MRAEIFVEPSREQWFWVRGARWLFAPKPGHEHPLARWFGIFTVVPSTNFTNFSLQYQSYLNDIFHTTWFARMGHAVATPFIVMFLIGTVRTLGGDAAGLLFTGVMLAWWLTWAALERDVVWGLCLGATGLGMWFAAGASLRLGVAPFGPLAAFSALQMLSHTFEPLPPRVSRSPRWVPVLTYLTSGTGGQRVLHAGHIGIQFVFGAVAELSAAPRLVCVIVLEGLWLLGWRRDRRTAWKALSRRAIESGNPALDYIGIGGGTPLQNP